jgi:8-oxo-dGTP pyrophosphatase MutT (NUDIX family)
MPAEMNRTQAMITVETIRQMLAGHAPEPFIARGGTRAAVALILATGPAGLQVLFIKRAVNPLDPWSGNISFPGGKVENGDGDPRATAEREALEEIGIDLQQSHYLGHLANVSGSSIPVHVSCFVYLFNEIGPFRLRGEEVADAFWVSLADLADPRRRGEKVVRFDGRTLQHPGVTLPYPGEPALWGLTYRLVMALLAMAGKETAQHTPSLAAGE